MSLSQWNAGKWIFKDVHGYGFPYCHIHPYKQDAVKHLVDNRPGWAEYIVIFGSSIYTWHFYEKDLDVCIVGNKELTGAERLRMYLPNVEYNILVYENMDELSKNLSDINDVKTAIRTEGILVYAK